MQGYETAGRLIFFGVWVFEYKIDICGMRPGNSDRNVVHYTGYNPGTHRTDNGNWNERE